MNKSELLTVAEACDNFRIGRSTFYREVAKGKIAIRKIGTSSRVSRADMDAWLESLPIIRGIANDRT